MEIKKGSNKVLRHSNLVHENPYRRASVTSSLVKLFVYVIIQML